MTTISYPVDCALGRSRHKGNDAEESRSKSSSRDRLGKHRKPLPGKLARLPTGLVPKLIRSASRYDTY